MDEPESALSRQRQLALLVRMAEGILEEPERYWRQLLREDTNGEDSA